MTDVSESYLESLRNRANFAEAALTIEQNAHGVTKTQSEKLENYIDKIEAAIAHEQREHDITEQQKSVLQQQCEDMQEELDVERKVSNGALKRYGYDETRIAKQERDVCNKVRIAQMELNRDLRREITNRDAVILEYERKADRVDKIMHEVMGQLKELRGCVEKRKDARKNRGSDKIMIMFSGKRHEMPTAEEREKRDRIMCKYWGGCLFRKASSETCNTGGGKYCGVWRKAEAETAGGRDRRSV